MTYSIKKNLFAIGIFALLPLLAYSQSNPRQNTISFSPYNKSDVGLFMAAAYSRDIKNDFVVNFGLLIHLNIDSRNPDRHQERYLHGRFWAYNSSEALGLSVGLEKKIFCFPSKKINLFLYEQTMFRRMGAKSMRFLPVDTVVMYDSSFQRNISYEGSRAVYTEIRNLLSVESVIGIGIAAKISPRLSLKIKAGFGLNIIANTPKDYFSANLIVEHSIQQSFGISYSF